MGINSILEGCKPDDVNSKPLWIFNKELIYLNNEEFMEFFKLVNYFLT